jgi:preprotein translocase subunit SecF
MDSISMAVSLVFVGVLMGTVSTIIGLGMLGIWLNNQQQEDDHD